MNSVGDGVLLLLPEEQAGFEPAHPCERCDLNTVRTDYAAIYSTLAGFFIFFEASKISIPTIVPALS